MAISRAVRRLLNVLEIQEEQCRVAMETALGELRQLEAALGRNIERERGGRRLVVASAVSGDITDRVAGMEQTRTAKRIAVALAPRIADAGLTVQSRRSEFLDKRVERRQTETLVEEAEAADRINAGRRAQRDLDDWYLGRKRMP